MTSRHSVILVTVDCLRRDHVGFLGYERAVTPFLDGLAPESLVFEQAVVAGTPTYYSFPAILASRYPLAFGRDVIGLVPGEPTLAGAFRRAGYATAAFVAGNPYLSRRFAYHEGFDEFDDFLSAEALARFAGDVVGASSPRPPGWRGRVRTAMGAVTRRWALTRALSEEAYFRYLTAVGGGGRDRTLDDVRCFPPADVVVGAALDWLARIGDRAFFLWIHLMDPHAPYYPALGTVRELTGAGMSAARAVYLNRFWSRDLSAARLRPRRDDVVTLYDAAVRGVDGQLERLAATLRGAGRWEDTVFAVTSDHGEEFLDHGGRYHAPVKLVEALIGVPLLIRFPAGAFRGRRRRVFSLLDLAPTLLDGVGLEPPADFRGRSADLRAETPVDQAVVTECVYGCTNPWRVAGRAGPRLLAVRDTRYKLVVNFGDGGESLFDLQHDPRERQALGGGDARETRHRLLEVAHRHLAEAGRTRRQTARLRARIADIVPQLGPRRP